MRSPGVSVLLAALLGIGIAVTGTPAAATPVLTHSVPPPAPKPTDSGNSPAAPDPHPPLGGLGPDDRPVGGAALLRRGLILPPHVAPLPADLSAQSFVVVNLDTGAVVAARDPHGRYQAASIQKLLTTATLLPLLPGSRRVTVSRRAAETEGSHAGLAAGGTYTIDQLFRALLLVSGNDAAEALAEAAGGRAHTVALMNAEALQLGAYDTFVQTPSGLDGWQQLTSAYDMALVLRAALAQPRFAAYDRAATSWLPPQRAIGVGPIQLYNQNELFLTTVPGALVAKTGFTDAAQHTFVGAITRNGHRYGVVFLRAQRWPLDQWQQATRLINWAAALPASTKPVGYLAGPVVPAGRASSATTGGGARAVSAPGSGSGSSLALVVLIAVGVLGVLTALGWWLFGARRPAHGPARVRAASRAAAGWPPTWRPRPRPRPHPPASRPPPRD